jgi:molybdopterin converting factor small subunit
MPTIATSVVTVRVLLFGSYAEALGRDSLELGLQLPATVGQLLDRLREQPGGQRLPPRPLIARNLSHVGLEAALADGDEVAILPPLAGG